VDRDRNLDALSQVARERGLLRLPLNFTDITNFGPADVIRHVLDLPCPKRTFQDRVSKSRRMRSPSAKENEAAPRTSHSHNPRMRQLHLLSCLCLVGCSPRTPIDVRTCEQNMPIVRGVEPDQAVIIKWVSVTCHSRADCLDSLRKHACELHGTEIVIQSDPSTGNASTALWSVPAKGLRRPFDNLVVSAWITRHSSSGVSQN